MSRCPYSRTLFELLHEQAELHPRAPAVIDAALIVSYSELLQSARRIAGALLARGVRRGDRVGMLIDNRVEWLQWCFGANALGATVVPFSTWSTQAEIEYLLAHSQIRALVTLARCGQQDFCTSLSALLPESMHLEPGAWRSAHFESLSTVIVIGESPATGWETHRHIMSCASADVALVPGEAASAQDDAYILYTSGSSARPKAVRLVNYALIENGFNIGERQGLTMDDRVLLPPPLFWSYGAANAVPAVFTHGAALVLQHRFEASEAMQLIERHQCTALYTLPNITHAIIRHPLFSPHRTRSLRKGLTIGNAEEIRLAATTLGVREICNVYGATEMYGNCCVTQYSLPLADRMRFQGRPLPGVRIRIVDAETSLPVVAGSVGEVEVAGYTTPGYWQESNVTTSTFTIDGFYRTGDFGSFDAEGNFEFVGRGSEFIKKNGISVSPTEIEELLQRHPAISRAAVVGAETDNFGEVIIAFVVPELAQTLTYDEMREYCKLSLSNYKIPDRLEICESLPSTESGKVSRRSLRQLAASLLKSHEN
jgi:fatty-acyl-CoA synthase